MSPAVALGARSRLNERLRKSQSTRITRAPLCAQSCASDADTVDLPSLGNDDVTPITLLDLEPPLRSAVTFTARNASANWDSGESTTYRSKCPFAEIILAAGRFTAALLTGVVGAFVLLAKISPRILIAWLKYREHEDAFGPQPRLHLPAGPKHPIEEFP